MVLTEITSAFELGDVVKLKSGGPEMTVTEVKADYVFVVFFNERENAFSTETFLKGSLKIAI